MRSILARIGRILLLMLLVIAVSFVIGETIGDGDLPEFYSMPVEKLADPVTQNTTAHLAQSKLPRRHEESWMALYHTLRILETASPEISDWVRDRNNKNLLILDFNIPVDHPSYSTTYAFQSVLTGHLLLSSHFWRLTDIEKAGVLVHEYRHSRQNFFKVMAGRAWQVLSIKGLLNPDESVLEDEAYLYQSEFYKAIGYRAPAIEAWLKHRGILKKNEP